MDATDIIENQQNEETKCGEIFHNRRGNIRYLCLICTASVSEATEFDKHMVMHFEAIVRKEQDHFQRSWIQNKTNLPIQEEDEEEFKFENAIETLKIESVNDQELTNGITSQCEYCDQRFLCVGLKESHGPIHGLCGKSFTCKYCTATFDSRIETITHQSLHTSTADTIECRHCQQIFGDILELKEHISYDPYLDKEETIVEEGLNSFIEFIEFKLEENSKFDKEDAKLKEEDNNLEADVLKGDDCKFSEYQLSANEFNFSENESMLNEELRILREEEAIQKAKNDNDAEKKRRKRKPPSLYCNKCDRIFSVLRYYRDHMKRHTIRNNQISRNKSVMLRRRSERRALRRTSLKENSKLIGERELISHAQLKRRKRRAPNLQCPKCDKMFSVVRYYNEHIRAHRIRRKKILENATKSGARVRLLKINENVPEPMAQSKEGSGTSDDEKKRRRRKPPTLNCNKCDRKFSVLRYFKEHMRRHATTNRDLSYSDDSEESNNSEFEFGGTDEQEITHDRSNFETNKQLSENGKQERIFCNTCHKSFHNQIQYNRHILTTKHRLKVEEDAKILEQIGESNWDFGQETAPKQHCDECNINFTSLAQYKRHMKQHDPNTEPSLFYCDICGQSTRQRGNLVVHMRLHTGEKPYSCPICDKRFNYSSYVRGHIRMMHTGERPYLCTVCGKGFATGSKLNTHTKTHRTSAEKVKHECHVCDKVYANRSTLRKHLGTHSELTPIDCDLCPRKFRSRNMMLQHRQIHSGTKPYLCKYCGIGFAQDAGRRGHEKHIHRDK